MTRRKQEAQAKAVRGWREARSLLEHWRMVRSCGVQNCKKRTPGAFSLQAVGIPLNKGRGWAYRMPTDCEGCGVKVSRAC